MSFIRQGILAAAVLGVGTTAIAAPTVDGTRDGEYGSALAVQTVQTQFGDDTGSGGGSEMDAGYGVITGGRLYLMLTGNIEGNFNKLEIFIDSKTGGQSVFDSSGNDNAGRLAVSNEGTLQGTVRDGVCRGHATGFLGDASGQFLDC